MKRLVIIGLAVLSFANSQCEADRKLPGKYCGAVIFDRWGGCTLYDGIFVMYVADALKEQLRDQAGKCIQVDATDVYQFWSPGPAVINKFTILGFAPDSPDWESPNGLRLSVEPAFENGQIPSVKIRVENVSHEPITLRLDSLAPTLFAKNGIGLRGSFVSNGRSSAVITDEAFWVGSARLTGGNTRWFWRVTKPETFEIAVPIQAGGKFEIELTFTLPAGEYDFLAGYGGGVQPGKCIASNFVGFDVDKDGLATLVKDRPAVGSPTTRK